MADPRMSMMSMVSTSSVKPNTKLLNSWNIPYDDVKFQKALGQGFFGTVYKAKYLGTDVAIKQLKDFRDQEASMKFENEVAMLQGVRHPGVVTFMGMIRHDTGLYIVTEFVGGGNLKQVIRDKKTPFPWALRRRIASDIAKALAYLHARRVIHRDLKSANVLLDEYQRAKIADFGLARSFSRNADKSVVGTMDWMAPEMLMGQRYTEKADVYSYGLVLFEMILRKKPDPDQYRTGTFNIDIKKVRAKTPADCPDALFKVFENCVLSDPEARPSMLQVVEMLDEVVANDSVPVPAAPRPNKVTKKQTNRMSMFSNDYYSDDEDVDDDEEEAEPEPEPEPLYEDEDDEEEPEADVRARNRMSARLKERAEKVFSTQYTPQYDSDNAGSENDFYHSDSDKDDDEYSDDSTRAVGAGSGRSRGGSGGSSGGLAASIVTGVGSRGAGERLMGGRKGSAKGGRPPAPPVPPEEEDSDDGFGSDHSFRSSDSKPKAPARPEASSRQKVELASELTNVLHQRKGSVSARRKMFSTGPPSSTDSPRQPRRPSLGRQGSRGSLGRKGSGGGGGGRREGSRGRRGR